jgi:hypothetical protein
MRFFKMKRFLFLSFITALMMLLNGCHDKNTDTDGVPTQTDVKHLIDTNGKPLTTEEFLKKWCPGDNKTPITNKNCIMVQNQRNLERNIDSVHGGLPKGW